MLKDPKHVNWSLLPTTPDVWSPEYAWWLGLMFGDGSLYFKPSNSEYRVSVSGHAKERNSVQKWAALICPAATIHHASEHGVEAYFHDANFAQWFSNAWFSGDKMVNMRYPAGKVPANVFRHFVRGLIDSDGGVHIREGERGNPSFIISFDSSVPGFTSSLAEDLWAAGLPKVGVITTKKKDQKTGKTFLGWRLKWTGTSALAVAAWLYEGSTTNIREDGRYAACQEALKQQADLALPCKACNQKPKFSGGLCMECLWKTKPKQSDKPCSICWSRPCTANSMCNACFKAAKRPVEVRAKRVFGNCTICSVKLTFRGTKKCPACAKKEWESCRVSEFSV